jgi:hypothetical protein
LILNERDKERYARDPLATTHNVDWWHVAGARFTRRMRPADRHEWDRFARRVSVRAKDTPQLPEPGAAVYAVVLSGRLRLAIPAPTVDEPGPAERRPDAPKPKEDPAASASKADGRVGLDGYKPPAEPERAPPPPAQAPAPPKHPIVYIAEAGDLVGTFGAVASAAPVVALQVEALRDTELLLASPDAFRGYMWRRGAWAMPGPTTRAVPQAGARGAAIHAVSQAIDLARGVGGRTGVDLSDLCHRTRNARASLALLHFLGRGHALAGPELRIRRRLWPAQLARRIGADVEWVKLWIRYAESEDVLSYARGRWTISQQWRLHRWASQVATEQSFELPPDPFDEPLEPEVTLGRASRNADGTTPTVEAAADGSPLPPY